MEFMLNQFPRDSRHVSRLPYKDVPIFLEEFDKHEFLFEIQGVAYVSNLGRFLHRQWYLLPKCVLFQLPVFCRCCQSISHLVALLVVVISSLDVSLDGDDSTWSCHL
jgi:hypothetical protein